MKRDEIPWTEAEDTLARKLLADGLSYSEVAAKVTRLGTHRTRHAVIGRAHRQGFVRSTKVPVRRFHRAAIMARVGQPLSPERARAMALTRWKSNPPKPPTKPALRIDVTAPASLAAAAILANAKSAEARRAMYRGRSL